MVLYMILSFSSCQSFSGFSAGGLKIVACVFLLRRESWLLRFISQPSAISRHKLTLTFVVMEKVWRQICEHGLDYYHYQNHKKRPIFNVTSRNFPGSIKFIITLKHCTSNSSLCTNVRKSCKMFVNYSLSVLPLWCRHIYSHLLPEKLFSDFSIIGLSILLCCISANAKHVFQS